MQEISSSEACPVDATQLGGSGHDASVLVKKPYLWHIYHPDPIYRTLIPQYANIANSYASLGPVEIPQNMHPFQEKTVLYNLSQFFVSFKLLQTCKPKCAMLQELRSTILRYVIPTFSDSMNMIIQKKLV